MGKDLIFKIYADIRTVFTLQEVAILTDEPDFNLLKQQVHYYVSRGKLKRLRRGIYAKYKYSPEELACKIFAPSYISLEYVMQKSGMIFQYSGEITCISYLSRTLTVDGIALRYRKIRTDILYNTMGISRDDTGINIATPERAFLDYLYLNKQLYAVSAARPKRETLLKLLPVYDSKVMDKRLINYI